MEEVKKPFQKEEELNQKLERLSELNALLNMDEKETVMEGEEERMSLEKKNVLFMKKSVHIKRVLNWKMLKTESGYQARFVLAK